MSLPAITVDDLWKEYVLGGAGTRARSFREMLASLPAAPLRRLRRLQGRAPEAERLWALREVGFCVQPGEVVGVIGHNGAGKSTLLKVLSRITAPTRGRIEIRGRVSSLLEVGTGFHPELTGRENIVLNGAILGMSRREIRRSFDEIVAFAGVERFLDTPVKRYSSGMRVRLAFSVAAHLEPEVLLVDEVLAVGDAEFQRRCLGKMREVASHGRTVLFVSHNLEAVRNLCGRTLLCEKGRVQAHAHAAEAIGAYLGGVGAGDLSVSWDVADAPGRAGFRLRGLAVRGADGPGRPVHTAGPIEIELAFDLGEMPEGSLCVGFDLTGPDGGTVFRSYQTDGPAGHWPSLGPGHNRLVCVVPAGLLNDGRYFVHPLAGVHNQEWFVNAGPALSVEVQRRHGESPLWRTAGPGSRPGLVAPLLEWRSAP